MIFLKSLLVFVPFYGFLTQARSVSPKHTSNITWVDCAQNVPQSTTPSGSFNASTIDLKNLPARLHCGRIDVPMDYSKPMCEGNTITLGMAVYKSLDSTGALFFNPGGTDAGVVVAWEEALNITQVFSGVRDFDLVVMDVRGTYSSNPLNVSLETFAGISGRYPTNQSEYDTFNAASATVIQSWVDNSSPPGIIEHVGTREVVQDYEMIRKALGFEKINFLGASYGTYRAAQYAITFPERVGHLVLDAAVPHGRSSFDQAQDAAAAINRIMLRADAYCQNDTTCPFHSQGKGSILKALHKVLEAAENTPYCISPCSNDTESNTYITKYDIQTGLSSAILGSPDFPAIFTALKLALSGDARAFVGGSTDVQGVVAMPLLCSDQDYEQTFEAFQKSYSDGLKNDITGIGLIQRWQIELFCSAWKFPVPAISTNTQICLKNQMLFVTAEFDASAPIEWSTFTWLQAPNSGLVVRHGDDHVSFTLVDQPSTRITKDFLNSGKLPSAFVSELVTVYTPGMIQAPISDPYEVPTGAVAGDIDSGEVVQVPF